MYFSVGVTINYKFALSLLLLIFILSVSAVSANSMDNENLLILHNFEFTNLLMIKINFLYYEVFK